MGDSRLTVVLVDDSPDVRRLLRLTLESSGLFEVVGEGGDGDEGVILAHRHHPDLVLLDTSMPRMDGLEALPVIRSLSPATAVVMFTGFEDARLAARARELGAAAFVEKSTPLEEVAQRLAGLFRGDGDTRAEDDTPAPEPAPATLHAVPAERAVLEEHIASFRDLFDQAAIGMATLTIAGRVVRANRALADLFSAGPADLVGVDYGQLAPGKGPDLDHALVTMYDDGADLATFEHDLPAVDDRSPGTARVTLVPIRDSRGQVLYVFAQVQDITEQRAAENELRISEERFRLLVRGVSEYAIFLLDPEGRVASWNAGARRIKGYEAEEVLGRHFEIFYRPEEREQHRPAHNLEVALREGTYAEEGWRVRRDGTPFWASVVISPVLDDRGGLLGFAKVTRDRTDQRRYEQERQDLVAQQTEVLALTAHELRTPSAVVDGSARLLQSSWSELSVKEREDLLDGIRTSAERLHRLAGDLSAASRLHAGTLDLLPAPTGIRELVEDAVTRARNLHPRTSVELRSALDEDVTLPVDATRLGQALDNLLDNAVRHGAAPVTVTLTADADCVRIEVADAGPGVPEVLRPRLFEMFASAGPYASTGLGLYLVRQVARRHGGDATYLPAEDGPTVALTLPRPA